MTSLAQTCLPGVPVGAGQPRAPSRGKPSPKIRLKLLHAGERDVLKRLISPLMERAQENTAIAKWHMSGCGFTWQIADTASMSINMDTHLKVNTSNNNVVITSSAEKKRSVLLQHQHNTDLVPTTTWSRNKDCYWRNTSHLSPLPLKIIGVIFSHNFFTLCHKLLSPELSKWPLLGRCCSQLNPEHYILLSIISSTTRAMIFYNNFSLESIHLWVSPDSTLSQQFLELPWHMWYPEEVLCFAFLWPRGTKHLKFCRALTPMQGLLQTDQLNKTPFAFAGIPIDNK